MPIEILDPRAEMPEAAAGGQGRLRGLRGRRVVLFSNNKPNVDHLFAGLTEELGGRFGVTSVRIAGKPKASRAATSAELEAAARDSDVALVAIGD
ncbi:MAG TPA: hypothetical protein VIL95_03870 [Bacillota bacterium]